MILILLLLLLLLGAAPALADPPRLRGIVTGGGDRVAVLGFTAGGTVPLREGEQAEGFTVRRILPDRVILDGEGQVLELRFEATQGAPPVADTGGVTFGLVVNPPAPAPD